MSCDYRSWPMTGLLTAYVGGLRGRTTGQMAGVVAPSSLVERTGSTSSSRRRRWSIPRRRATYPKASRVTTTAGLCISRAKSYAARPAKCVSMTSPVSSICIRSSRRRVAVPRCPSRGLSLGFISLRCAPRQGVSPMPTRSTSLISDHHHYHILPISLPQ